MLRQKFRIFETLSDSEGVMHYSDDPNVNIDKVKSILLVGLDGMPKYVNKHNKTELGVFIKNNLLCAEVLMSIGCVDINNKELYEADIVKFTTDNYGETTNIYGTIVYGVNDSAKYTIYCESKYNQHIPSLSDNNLYFEISSDFCKDNNVEIIGNAYENPTLLQEVMLYTDTVCDNEYIS